ncbi:uncharacterized protein TrAtP1_001469 [Trichoderma atroviride]|uniref:Uncharacterized protein n=1 Tax=Hypocrea atroviridis (strain ATCC 20476 / IMI 206040) TaxID=452589 RepID=G9P1B8_HYPAI|nr:uncharacterized protein TRIATDRAFT_310850 [Trichoderma atroviride IMI 206040]EHK43306.1 hypothetical protein TRIATDRAFT_310850 [Trichoderma atroviride IMI 206040]UKZ60184.1 hypothetical protein TrAtP1_001469 [Trichoderma atroviride]
MESGTWASWKLQVVPSEFVSQFANIDYRYCFEVGSNTQFLRVSRVVFQTVLSPWNQYNIPETQN